jgi:hypothetical protein
MDYFIDCLDTILSGFSAQCPPPVQYYAVRARCVLDRPPVVACQVTLPAGTFHEAAISMQLFYVHCAPSLVTAVAKQPTTRQLEWLVRLLSVVGTCFVPELPQGVSLPVIQVLDVHKQMPALINGIIASLTEHGLPQFGAQITVRNIQCIERTVWGLLEDCVSWEASECSQSKSLDPLPSLCTGLAVCDPSAPYSGSLAKIWHTQCLLLGIMLVLDPSDSALSAVQQLITNVVGTVCANAFTNPDIQEYLAKSVTSLSNATAPALLRQASICAMVCGWLHWVDERWLDKSEDLSLSVDNLVMHACYQLAASCPAALAAALRAFNLPAAVAVIEHCQLLLELNQ